TIQDALHLAAGFLDREKLAGPEKHHSGRLIQPADDGRHLQVRIGEYGSLWGRKRCEVHSKRAEESVMFLVWSRGEQQSARRGRRNTQPELESPKSQNLDALAAGVAHGTQKIAGIEIENVDHAVSEVADKERVVESAEPLERRPCHAPRRVKRSLAGETLLKLAGHVEDVDESAARADHVVLTLGIPHRVGPHALRLTVCP